MSDPRRTPEVRLTKFVSYASTAPSRRWAVAADTSGYVFYKDFYLGLRRALSSDRRTTRDGAALHAAAQNASARHARRYSELAAKWSAEVDRWNDCVGHDVEPMTHMVGGLAIHVSVPFAEIYPDGTVELVFVRFPKDPLEGRVIDMMLRLVQLAYAELIPGAVVTFLDLERGVLRTTEGRDLSGQDFWIDAEAADLANALLQGGREGSGAA